jgi:hypothetical protein
VHRKPRAPRTKRVERVKAMAQDYDASEYIFTNENKVFEGSALDLIKSVYAAEALPIKVRLYAATKAAEYENRLGEDGQPIGNAQMHIYLPDNGRDPELLAELGSVSLEEREAWQKKREARHKERNGTVECRDAQLRSWITGGKMTEAQALLARSQWIQSGDPPWQSVELPAPPRALPWQPSERDSSAPVNGIIVASYNNGQEIQLAPVVILFSYPGSVFEVSSGRRYRASPRGEIEVTDPADRDELLTMGCRARR